MAATAPSVHQPMPYTGDVRVKKLQEEITHREKMLAQHNGQCGGEWLQQERLETARSALAKLLGPATGIRSVTPAASYKAPPPEPRRLRQGSQPPPPADGARPHVAKPTRPPPPVPALDEPMRVELTPKVSFNDALGNPSNDEPGSKLACCHDQPSQVGPLYTLQAGGPSGNKDPKALFEEAYDKGDLEFAMEHTVPMSAMGSWWI